MDRVPAERSEAPPSPTRIHQNVTKSAPEYLRLYTERVPAAEAPSGHGIAALAELCQAFEQATGWPLRYMTGEVSHHDPDLMWSAPVNPGVGTALGHFRMDRCGTGLAESAQRIELAVAGELAAAVAELTSELVRTRHALWQREAELAAGVPIVEHRQEKQHLAQRLEAVLQGGADAIGCQAAALYLLDDTTQALRLRAVWNLSHDRFTAPPRALRTATADLEALCGHAVVLEDARLFDHWNLPDTYPAAVCVPVSSPTVPLGTLWFFAEKKRPFSDHEVNIIEVIAGRLAADLEREMLLVQGAEKTKITHQLDAAERLQQNQLPQIAPLIEGWDIAGWTTQASRVGGAFHDWFVRSDDQLVIATADCLDSGLDAALSASGLRAALRAHAQYTLPPHQLLKRVNHSLWTGSAGDQYASLFCGLIDPLSGRFCFAAAGHPSGLLLRSSDVQSLVEPTLPLGLEPDTRYTLGERQVAPGDVLIIANQSVRDTVDDQGRPFGQAGLVQAIAGSLDATAETLAELMRDRLENHAHKANQDDRALLVIRRLPL
jgi:sigma-B regulation protein RsbU (phosphoserine phosphatase)